MRSFILSLCLVLLSLGLKAQNTRMVIRLSDSTLINYNTSQIDKVAFDDSSVEQGPVGMDHAIDLGLSVKWADMNVGATLPEEYGNYYAWGEVEPKDVYNIETILSTTNDVAHEKWGGDWRLPTRAELEELNTNCKKFYEIHNGVFGLKLVGPNGKSIFLPAAGYRSKKRCFNAGIMGLYWAGEEFGSIGHGEGKWAKAVNYFFKDYGAIVTGSVMYYGFSVRAVCP